MGNATNMPVEIFCCYAREDQELLNKLKAHLMPLQRQGLIAIWADTDIGAGAEWEKEINQHLNTAQIILLLISPDFMNSDYCYSKEMARAIERHEQSEARVIPIILRPVYWKKASFGKLQALPTNAKPAVSSHWYSQDEAFLDVTTGILEVATAIFDSIAQTSTQQAYTQQVQVAKVELKAQLKRVQQLKWLRQHLLVVVLAISLTISLIGNVIAASYFFTATHVAPSNPNPTSTASSAQATMTATTTPTIATPSSPPTSSPSPFKWRTILTQQVPTCDNPQGTAWKVLVGTLTCRSSSLAMQQTSENFAEVDLSQVNNKAFTLTTFRIQVTATFQDATDVFTYASLFVQMPQKDNGVGGYILQVTPDGFWHLVQVTSGRNIYGLDDANSKGGAIGQQLTQVTITAVVQNGIFSASVKNTVLFNQFLSFNPSPAVFGLMASSKGTNSSLIYFSHFELDVPA